jgi:hypothetical protein
LMVGQYVWAFGWDLEEWAKGIWNWWKIVGNKQFQKPWVEIVYWFIFMQSKPDGLFEWVWDCNSKRQHHSSNSSTFQRRGVDGSMMIIFYSFLILTDHFRSPFIRLLFWLLDLLFSIDGLISQWRTCVAWVISNHQTNFETFEFPE